MRPGVRRGVGVADPVTASGKGDVTAVQADGRWVALGG